MASEARKFVWKGAIPLTVSLHESEVTTIPSPPPFLVLAPRISYLPLLVPSMKSHFQSFLPPGSDTVWFDYHGLPLKWHIPTGVLFDLLCAEPERPWSLMVHFRTYPSELLSPCGGDDAIKWNFVNSLKEASYIMYGSTKGVMNMSQSDQLDLWRSVVTGDLEAYDRFSARLKPASGMTSGGSSAKSYMRRQISGETGIGGSDIIKPESGLPGKVGFRLYIRQVKEDIIDIIESPPMESWDNIVYITRPVEIFKDDGTVFTLGEALNKIVPQLLVVMMTKTSGKVDSQDCQSPNINRSGADMVSPVDNSLIKHVQEAGILESKKVIDKGKTFVESPEQYVQSQILRLQGIEPSLDLPLDWILQNLCGPEQLVHVCIIRLDCNLSRDSPPPKEVAVQK